MPDSLEILRRAFATDGIGDPLARAGIAAIAMGESGLAPRTEASYSHTPNARIRAIFPSRLGHLGDDDLDRLKSDDAAFFDAVYGGMLGNHLVGDGYRYRGRGIIQLTGRGNYAALGRKLGVALEDDPDLANDPETAARIACAYVLARWDGVSWASMKRCVGNAVASTEAIKDAAFARFQREGTFA